MVLKWQVKGCRKGGSGHIGVWDKPKKYRHFREGG